jgi:hypothetical protein
LISGKSQSKVINPGISLSGDLKPATLKPSKLKLTFKLEPVIQSLAIVNLKSEFS